MDRRQPTFLDWTTDEVLEWLEQLSLSRDYAVAFRDGQIDGAKLLKMNQWMLDKLQVYDQSDRLVLLQMVTMMRANQLTNSHGRSPVYRGHTPTPAADNERSSPMMKAVTDSRATNKRGSPTARNGSWQNITAAEQSNPHISKEGSHVFHGYAESPVQHQSQFIRQRKSGMRPRAFSEMEADSQVSTLGDWLVVNEHLKEENASLKKEVNHYYGRTKRLQKLEQEMEQVREANQLLEASTQRREALEKTMRKKLEEELRQQKETNLQLQVELQCVKASAPNKKQRDKTGAKKDIERRDSVIIQLLRKQCESAELRERLEADLLQTQAQLREERRSQSVSDVEGEGADNSSPQVCSSTHGDNVTTGKPTGEAARLYLSSIEGLRGALLSLKGISQKRERLEEKLRHQLEREVESLRSLVHKSSSDPRRLQVGLESQAMRERDIRIATLEADLARLEQKCMELSTERQMTVDAATLPRDAHLSHLERVVQDLADTNTELKQQKMNYIEKLYSSNRRVTDLESRLQSMHAAITEKDSLIRTLQEVFQSEGPSRVHSSSTHPFQNDNGNVTRMTRATSSDNILLASPPASPGKRRRVLTDLPPSGGPKGGIFGLRSPPSRVGSLMRAASDDQLADHKPRCIHIKGQNSLTEGRRSATPLMSCSKSNDDYLDDEEAQPAPRRRVKSVDVRHWTGKRLTRVDMMKLTQINRVRSCDSGLEEGGVAHTNSAIVMTGSDGGLVRLLTNEKAKLTNHFLESLAKATSVESISSSSVGSSPSSPMLQVTQQKTVHRFSAYSPTCKQRSRQEAETALLALGKSRSASCEVLDNVSHHLPVSHNSLSDGELDHPWCGGDGGSKVTDSGVDKGDGDKEVTDGGVDKGDHDKEVTDGGVDKGDGDKADSDVFFAATESCYISHDIGRGSPSSTAPARQGVYPAAGPTPVSSLAKVTQKVVVRKRSVGKLPLTAWTTTSTANHPKGKLQTRSHTKPKHSHPLLV